MSKAFLRSKKTTALTRPRSKFKDQLSAASINAVTVEWSVRKPDWVVHPWFVRLEVLRPGVLSLAVLHPQVLYSLVLGLRVLQQGVLLPEVLRSGV